jgi:hypothetical protein
VTVRGGRGEGGLCRRPHRVVSAPAPLELGEQGVRPHLDVGQAALAGYGGDRRQVAAQLVRIDGVEVD